MIFPVCEKKQAKIAAIIAYFILLICIVVIIAVAVTVTFKDIVSLVVGIVAMCCIAIVLLAVGSFAHVVVDDFGVTLCIKSLPIKHFAWDKIKRAEVVKGFRGVRGGKDCTVINVLIVEKESSMFKNKVYV